MAILAISQEREAIKLLLTALGLWLHPAVLARENRYWAALRLVVRRDAG